MSSEFPLLEGQGLYASDIIGDGDCLFRSFSDQLYGHQEKAHKIRLRTTSYMRQHASYFKLFLSVPPPTRKTRSSTTLPTEQTIDRAFIDHVNRMEKAGVYGDNLEIVAFARCYNVDVKIYQREFAYMVSGQKDPGESSDEDDDDDDDANVKEKGGERKVLHIAYHDWEHYSSVRNIDGPHKGLPNVTPKELTEEAKAKQKKVLEEGVVIMPWMEDVVEKSLPGFVGKVKIREALERSKGNVNEAVSRLLDEVSADEESGGKEAKEEDSGVDIGDSKEETTIEEKKEDPPPVPKKDVKPPPKRNPNAQNKPKRETARERKERQQREKMDKKKAKAAGSSGKSSKDSKDGTAKDAASQEEGMRTLHV